MIHSFLDALADATVLLSFDRGGFLRHRSRFDPRDLEVDLSGKICLVTGANSGLGLATCRGLARLGATVHLLCRDRARGEAALEQLRRETGSERLELGTIDLSRLASVRACAAGFRERRVDVLVNNAGVLPAERTITEDGLELTWATNVVGPFLLTELLRPALARAAQGRIVNVSSGGMLLKRLALDDLAWRRRRFDGVAAYANTKRAIVILTELWARELATTRITVNSMHPGWADTPAVRSSLPRFHALLKRRLRDADEGADTIVWLAAAPRAAAETGRFFFDRRPRETAPVPGTRESEADRQALFRLCREQAGLPG